jgi:hypothetical protein
VQESIRETGRGASGSLRQSRFRQALIVVEVALSVCCWRRGSAVQKFHALAISRDRLRQQQVLTAG